MTEGQEILPGGLSLRVTKKGGVAHSGFIPIAESYLRHWNTDEKLVWLERPAPHPPYRLLVRTVSPWAETVTSPEEASVMVSTASP